MQRLEKHLHIHRFKASNDPAVEVEPGSTLVVECNDALEGRGAADFDARLPRELVIPHANPATGPIFVKGAEPGDALEVRINRIDLGEIGYLTAKPGRIGHDPHILNSFETFAVSGGCVDFRKRRLPVEPMVGVIGTAPAGGLEAWAVEAGDHGGNMDTKIIRPGSVVSLPVFVAGGLLALGDVHAVMGDGEVFGQGLEIRAEVSITVSVRKAPGLRRPFVESPDAIAAVASHSDIYAAQDLATRDLGEYVMNRYELDRVEAWTLIAFYADLQFCQVVNPQKTVRMSLSKERIRQMVSA